MSSVRPDVSRFSLNQDEAFILPDLKVRDLGLIFPGGLRERSAQIHTGLDKRGLDVNRVTETDEFHDSAALERYLIQIRGIDAAAWSKALLSSRTLPWSTRSFSKRKSASKPWVSCCSSHCSFGDFSSEGSEEREPEPKKEVKTPSELQERGRAVSLLDRRNKVQSSS
jgi:hypothetical protein